MNNASEPLDGSDWRPPAWSRRAAGTSLAPENPNAVTVLVVEDDRDLRCSEADILRTVGYTVTEASDGGDALSLLSTMHFDVMVLDLNMPRLDGPALLGLLRRSPPVVVVSAQGVEKEVYQEAGSVIVSWMRKPVTPEELLQAVARAVVIERPSSIDPASPY